MFITEALLAVQSQPVLLASMAETKKQLEKIVILNTMKIVYKYYYWLYCVMIPLIFKVLKIDFHILPGEIVKKSDGFLYR